MNKKLTYILLGVLGITLILLMLRGSSSEDRKLDTRLSLRKRDKIPYGSYLAWQNLSNQFPAARVATESAAPGYWTSISEYQKNQVLIVVAPEFKPTETEMRTLLRFVENGNDIFVSTLQTSFVVEKRLGCDIVVPAYDNPVARLYYTQPDSMTLSLTVPAGSPQKTFSYPGHYMDTWFAGMDTLTSRVLGYNKRGKADFIGLNAGKGNFYLHLAPMAFTNYFMLHKQNMEYYDRALSLLPKKATTVVWDEYFLSKRREAKDNENPHWLRALMNMENAEGKKPFRTALWLLMGLLLLYVLSEMRRKQRVIPVVRRPANDSLDFVKTIGRLYHDKGDHANLCRKMTAYFLEHVRSRYKLPTQYLNEQFVMDLVYKSGADEKLVREIIDFIGELNNTGRITAQGMAWYHYKLEQFYNQS